MATYNRGSGNYGFAIIQTNGDRTNHWFFSKIQRDAKKVVAQKECKRDLTINKIINCERNL